MRRQTREGLKERKARKQKGKNVEEKKRKRNRERQQNETTVQKTGITKMKQREALENNDRPKRTKGIEGYRRNSNRKIQMENIGG